MRKIIAALPLRLKKLAASAKNSKSTAPLIFLLCGMLLLTLSFPYKKVCTWQVSTVVTDRNGRPMTGTLSSEEEWSMPIPLERMGRWLPAAAVALEDRRFYTHKGIDAAAILRASLQNSRAGETISGGSTITSQVIRLAIERERTIPNKFLEFWQAWQLEQLLTKDGILELYLNRAPFGGNIRGVEAASLAWFAKPAADLSLAEATLLIGILRGPSFYRPDRHPERAAELRNRLLDTLAERGTATKAEVERAKLEGIPKERNAIPGEYRMASEKVVKSSGVLQKRDRFGRVRSTIDRSAQDILRAELAMSLSPLPATVTAAAVLIENETGAVRGYIGNARENSHTDASWVDCADSPRSPGSVLKPFVYALGFESGRLTPETMTADSPMMMGGGAPRNYDRHYRGPVSVRTALADSLNVPAVRAMRSEGSRRTIDLYRRLGFTHFTHDADWYGDSLALGGCEVTPLEIAHAYRALAQKGSDAPLKWTEADKTEKGHTQISPAACALVLDILKDTGRLMPLYADIFGEEGTSIAFKTGTSYGMRDAWAAAVTKKYTLAVWFGDPSGKPHQALVGLKTAAPAAVRIMRKLTPRGTKWFDLPKNVKTRPVCSLSGMAVSSLCPQTSNGLFIEGISSAETCTLHVIKDGHTAIKWPPELEGFFADAQNKEEKIQNDISIISPRKNGVYELAEGRDRLPLIAEGGSGTLYWFADGTLIEEQNNSSVFWKMTKGRHTISVTDDAGNNASAAIRIAEPKKENKEKETLPILEEIP